MYIKEIKRNDSYTADIVVTDGQNEILCFCWGIHDEIDISSLKPGTVVKNIIAFSNTNIIITRSETKNYLIKALETPFSYTFQGKIESTRKAIIKVGDITISLNQEFEGGLPQEFKNGDFVKFTVDRLDCTF